MKTLLFIIVSLFLVLASLSTYAATNPGLSYTYYEGNWTTVPNFDTLNPVKAGVSTNVDITLRDHDNQYAFLWQGYITIPADGTYTFETNSDDGSNLYIGTYSSTTNALVNNDGMHWAILKAASVYLKAGIYPITISFFQAANDNIMEVYWSSNTGIARQRIPDKAFSNGSQVQAFTGGYASQATNKGLAYSYYEGSWNNLPNFNTLTAVKTGISTNVDITLRDHDVNYAFLWQGYITIATEGIYTFETNSDDGSKLYLGTYSDAANALVNNNGSHWAINKSASMYLSAGTYPISISYFQGSADNIMDVYWSSSTGIGRENIPDSVFTNGSLVSTETGGVTGLVNYYFSTSDGDDSRTSTQAQNSSTPWKTLDKLNSFMPYANPGDAFLLKRGDVFDGTITIGQSGSADNDVILSAYGKGNKPVVNGFSSLTAWTNVGGNIWQSTLNAGSRLNMLTINDAIQMRGRYPNLDAVNRGYRKFTTHQGYTSITDPSLSDAINWTGAEISVRNVRWMLNTYKITAQNSGVINYEGKPEIMLLEPIDGFGYFIQNDPRTLDEQGEWYYNPVSKYVQLYSTTNPATLAVKAAIADTLVKGTYISYVHLDNVSFQGSNFSTLSFYGGNHITVSNCFFNFAGYNTIKTDQTAEFHCRGNEINNSNNNGIEAIPFCDSSVIEYNTVYNTGINEGLGANGNYATCGIITHGTGSVVSYNNVIKTGYNGIVMSGSYINLRHNWVDSFCLKLDDGAGLYTSGPGTNRFIVSNTALHGIGNPWGTNSDSTYSEANGIGLDDNSQHVLIDSNSVFLCAREGIGIHNTQDVIITNNTVYGIQLRSIGWASDIISPNNPVRNITLKHNIFFSNSPQPVINADGPYLRTNALAQFDTRMSNYDDLTKFGVSDSNYWIKPFYINSNDFFRTSYRPMPAGITVGPSQDDSNAYRTYVTLDFAHWQSTYHQDAHSTSGLLYPPYKVNSQETSTFSNGTFDANINYVLNPHASSTDANNNYQTMNWDNAHLDNGALQVIYAPQPGTNSGTTTEAWFYDKDHDKTLLAGHTYRVKFSVMGSIDNNADFSCLLRSPSTGETAARLFKVYNTRNEVELLFTPTSDVPDAFLVVINNNANICPVWWFDNLTVQEVNVSYSDPNDYVRLEYNASSNNKVVSLDGIYTDLKNNTYKSTVTLPPYTSVILLKQSPDTATVQSKTMIEAGYVWSEPTSAQTAKVVPNPAFDQIQVSLPVAAGRQTAIITIYSFSGVVVKSMQASMTSQPLHINIADFTPGAYVINIQYAGQHLTKKFIKL